MVYMNTQNLYYSTKKHQMKSGDRRGQLRVVMLPHYSYQKPQATFAPLSESLRSILHPNINLRARIVFSYVKSCALSLGAYF